MFDKHSAVLRQLLCICFSNERRIEELKNEYESKAAEREANKNGVLNLDEVREKHNKELAEIKVC